MIFVTSCACAYRRLLAGVVFSVIGTGVGAAQQAELHYFLTPNITIYPGDVIKAEWLTERDFGVGGRVKGRAVTTRDAIVGKIARRTLLPGAVIPANAVSEPKLIVNGAKVQILFQQGALSITTIGVALQDGAAGEAISLRNVETGTIVTGVVQADGSVRMYGG